MDMNEIKNGLGPSIFGAVAGAAALAIVGFNWGGWVTGSTAMEMSQAAIIDSLVPICVGQFNADSNKVMKLEELNKTDSWKRAAYVTEQGWATMPGASKAESGVARDCAGKITS